MSIKCLDTLSHQIQYRLLKSGMLIPNNNQNFKWDLKLNFFLLPASGFGRWEARETGVGSLLPLFPASLVNFQF